MRTKGESMKYKYKLAGELVRTKGDALALLEPPGIGGMPIASMPIGGVLEGMTPPPPCWTWCSTSLELAV